MRKGNITLIAGIILVVLIGAALLGILDTIVELISDATNGLLNFTGSTDDDIVAMDSVRATHYAINCMSYLGANLYVTYARQCWQAEANVGSNVLASAGISLKPGEGRNFGKTKVVCNSGPSGASPYDYPLPSDTSGKTTTQQNTIELEPQTCKVLGFELPQPMLKQDRPIINIKLLKMLINPIDIGTAKDLARGAIDFYGDPKYLTYIGRVPPGAEKDWTTSKNQLTSWCAGYCFWAFGTMNMIGYGVSTVIFGAPQKVMKSVWSGRRSGKKIVSIAKGDMDNALGELNDLQLAQYVQSQGKGVSKEFSEAIMYDQKIKKFPAKTRVIAAAAQNPSLPRGAIPDIVSMYDATSIGFSHGSVEQTIEATRRMRGASFYDMLEATKKSMTPEGTIFPGGVTGKGGSYIGHEPFVEIDPNDLKRMLNDYDKYLAKGNSPQRVAKATKDLIDEIGQPVNLKFMSEADLTKFYESIAIDDPGAFATFMYDLQQEAKAALRRGDVSPESTLSKFIDDYPGKMKFLSATSIDSETLKRLKSRYAFQAVDFAKLEDDVAWKSLPRNREIAATQTAYMDDLWARSARCGSKCMKGGNLRGTTVMAEDLAVMFGKTGKNAGNNVLVKELQKLSPQEKSLLRQRLNAISSYVMRSRSAQLAAMEYLGVLASGSDPFAKYADDLEFFECLGADVRFGLGGFAGIRNIPGFLVGRTLTLAFSGSVTFLHKMSFCKAMNALALEAIKIDQQRFRYDPQRINTLYLGKSIFEYGSVSEPGEISLPTDRFQNSMPLAPEALPYYVALDGASSKLPFYLTSPCNADLTIKATTLSCGVSPMVTGTSIDSRRDITYDKDGKIVFTELPIIGFGAPHGWEKSKKDPNEKWESRIPVFGASSLKGIPLQTAYESTIKPRCEEQAISRFISIIKADPTIEREYDYPGLSDFLVLRYFYLKDIKTSLSEIRHDMLNKEKKILSAINQVPEITDAAKSARDTFENCVKGSIPPKSEFGYEIRGVKYCTEPGTLTTVNQIDGVRTLLISVNRDTPVAGKDVDNFNYCYDTGDAPLAGLKATVTATTIAAEIALSAATSPFMSPIFAEFLWGGIFGTIEEGLYLRIADRGKWPYAP